MRIEAGPASQAPTAPWERLPEVQLRFLRHAGRRARALGFRLYLVGGPVRDLLLGHPSSDVDLMVEGDAVALAEALAGELGGGVRGRSQFATVKLHLPELVVDLATARTESYPYPGSLPVVSAASAAQDLCRRDFSINAIAMHLSPRLFGRLLDPCGGLADLRRRRLRVLHPASFRDDPLRLIRAVRLLCRLRLRLEPGSERLAREAVAAGALSTLTPRRLQEEFRLFLLEPAQRCQMRQAAALGLLGVLVPGLEPQGALLGRLNCALRLVGWLAAQAHPQHLERWLVVGLTLVAAAPKQAGLAAAHRLLPGKGASRAAAALTLEREQWVEFLSWPHLPSELAARLDALPEEAVAALACLLPAPARAPLRRYLARWRHLRPRLSGRHLLELGFAPSARWRQVLAELRAARMDGRARSRRDEVRLAVAMLTEQGSPGR